MEDKSYREVIYLISTILSHTGDVLLVGSNAYNIVENNEMHGDLDFVTSNRELIMGMNHKTRQGISGDIKVATICISGIMVDISTLDGINIEEDISNRSCVTSAIKFSLNGSYQVLSHDQKQRIIPKYEDAQVWVRKMILAKGKRLTRFWQKKLSKGFVWGIKF